MKVVIARKELQCTFCKMPIQKGDICIRTSFKDRINRSRWVFTFFHKECCCQQVYRNIQNSVKNQVGLFKVKLQEKESKPKLPRGRPRKYSDPYQAILLKSRIKYYKKVGHTGKVQELQAEMAKMERDCLECGG